MEKELFALDLQLRPPASLFADRPFGDAFSIRTIQEYGGGPRVLALYSETVDTMESALNDLRVIGKRLVQAKVLVVPIVKEGKLGIERNEWLATAASPSKWIEYFNSLASKEDTPFKWFGLSSSGRSFGSGAGSPPSWLQLMGQHLRPLDIIDPEESVDTTAQSKDGKEILGLQQQFYDALTTGKLEQLEEVFVREKTKEVTDVVAQGGRLDSWKFCLEDDARPEGMKVGNVDVTLESPTRAFSTAIEFPVADGLTDARLLAIQQWQRSDANERWKLVQHQTIPWSVDVPAAGRCMMGSAVHHIDITRFFANAPAARVWYPTSAARGHARIEGGLATGLAFSAFGTGAAVAPALIHTVSDMYAIPPEFIGPLQEHLSSPDAMDLFVALSALPDGTQVVVDQSSLRQAGTPVVVAAESAASKFGF
eukprot:scaffold1912_cov167-Amphora_coffeaeformis.AAC.41